MDEKAQEMFVAVMQVAEAITFRQRTKLMRRVLCPSCKDAGK